MGLSIRAADHDLPQSFRPAGKENSLDKPANLLAGKSCLLGMLIGESTWCSNGLRGLAAIRSRCKITLLPF